MLVLKFSCDARSPLLLLPSVFFPGLVIVLQIQFFASEQVPLLAFLPPSELLPAWLALRRNWMIVIRLHSMVIRCNVTSKDAAIHTDDVFSFQL